jgi:hypothetical protein
MPPCISPTSERNAAQVSEIADLICASLDPVIEFAELPAPQPTWRSACVVGKLAQISQLDETENDYQPYSTCNTSLRAFSKVHCRSQSLVKSKNLTSPTQHWCSSNRQPPMFPSEGATHLIRSSNRFDDDRLVSRVTASFLLVVWHHRYWHTPAGRWSFPRRLDPHFVDRNKPS